MDDLLTPEQVAARLRVTRRHVMRLSLSGAIPTVKVGRFNRYEPDAIDAYISGHRREVTRQAEPTLGESLGQITRRSA